ncbi:hypothetical protein Tco_1112758 [Tanacetum coccineum]|uniref:Uncharacterized protein n=1 Tax=Tanacetum coccineum TaxID=301880 RepID=A0ABQ5IRQ3_9ASTR
MSLMHRWHDTICGGVIGPRRSLFVWMHPSNGPLGSVREWKLNDCVAVHKTLGAIFDDNDAALRWKTRCAEYFPYSTYFEVDSYGRNIVIKSKGRSDGKAKEKILVLILETTFVGVESRVLIPEMTFVGVESRVLIPETTFVGVESRVLIPETTVWDTLVYPSDTLVIRKQKLE